jgi:prepilin-type processing-associated H-X9-DG protein
LLVVIAIIAILAALLLPSLSSARDTAKKIKCSSNLKNVVVAEMGYAGDYSWYAPGNFPLAAEAFNTQLWYHKLMPYLMAGKKYAAPTSWAEATGRGRIPALWCSSATNLGTDFYCYAPSGFGLMANNFGLKPAISMASTSTSDQVFIIKPESATPRIGPSKILFFSELGATTGAANGYVHYCIRNGTYYNGSDGGTMPAFRHNGYKNATFLDGHAEAVKLNQMDWNLYLP